jgi:hypothetical protein
LAKINTQKLKLTLQIKADILQVCPERLFFLESCLESQKILILQISDPLFRFEIFSAIFPRNVPQATGDNLVIFGDYFVKLILFDIKNRMIRNDLEIEVFDKSVI